MVSRKTPLAVTCGEPAGIGPDITLLAWCARKALGLPAFYVRADPGFLARRAKRLGLDVPVAADLDAGNGRALNQRDHQHAAVALQRQPRDDVEARLDALAVLEARLARVSRDQREAPVQALR